MRWPRLGRHVFGLKYSCTMFSMRIFGDGILN